MQLGTDPWEAAGFLGMSVKVLIDTYGHHHPDYMKEAAGAITKKRETAKRVVGERMERIITRAQESGQLRADFRGPDLAAVFGAALAGPDWRRGLSLILDGLRAKD